MANIYAQSAWGYEVENCSRWYSDFYIKHICCHVQAEDVFVVFAEHRNESCVFDDEMKCYMDFYKENVNYQQSKPV